MTAAAGDGLDRLRAAIAAYRRVVVAYSGGVDSALVAAVAHEVLGADALAATAVSPSLARTQRRAAAALARSRGWNHVVVRTDELARAGYVRNSGDRCYWCKTELFDVLGPIAARRGAVVAVGTNTDDLGDHRPGIAAGAERGVRAPLVEVGLSKSDIRALSRRLGLPTFAKPAAPCLASRIAYGVAVTPQRLTRIDRAEEAVRALGFSVVRVRDHGDIARVEVEADSLKRAAAAAAEIAAALKELGFRYVALDLEGFRSGSLNDALAAPRLRRSAL